MTNITVKAPQLLHVRICFCLFFCLCLLEQSMSQPLFRVKKPTCGTAEVEVLAPEIFATYQWDFGNGTTFSGRIPPPVSYNAGQTAVIQLTVTAATPFRVIDSVIITAIHPSSWIGSGFCLNENRPDLFLEFLNKTQNSPYWARTLLQNEAFIPAKFKLDGVLTRLASPISVWDQDDGVVCGASDFLGEVLIPQNTPDGVFRDDNNGLILTVRTKMVSSATCKQSFPVVEGLKKPVVTCNKDTLTTDYTYGLQWLNAQRQVIPGAVAQKFYPPAPGTYYVQHKALNACTVVSDAFAYNKGCAVVSVAQASAAVEMNLRPNPADGLFAVHLPEMPLPGSHIRIFDSAGQLKAEMPARSNRTEVNCDTWPSGFYQVMYVDEHGTAVKTVVVQHQSNRN